jgi:hypothetical protein
MGKGTIIGSSTKQKVNSCISTKSELIGVDDKISRVFWTKRFLEWQEFVVKLNIIYQDSTSWSKTAKRVPEKEQDIFDIKYFYVPDLISRDEVEIEYCSTDEMLADYSTKPEVGRKFSLFR